MTRLRVAILGLALLLPVSGLVWVQAGWGSDGSPGLRTFGPVTFEVPDGWHVPSERATGPEPGDGIELLRRSNGEVVAAAGIINGTIDVERAVERNGGTILRRDRRTVGGEAADVIESTNLSGWRFLDVTVSGQGYTFALRWDPKRGQGPMLDRFLASVSFRAPSSERPAGGIFSVPAG